MGKCNKAGCGLRLGIVTPCECGERCLAHCDCELARAAKAPGEAERKRIVAALENGTVKARVA
jgi:hypothetical protein